MDPKQNDVTTERTENASTEEIRSEIRGTRREMDQTLDELGERLHPRHLLDDVLDIFRTSSEGNASRDQLTRTSKRVGRTIAAELKEHPLPALLVGAGLLWWVVDANTDDPADEDQRERQRAEGVRAAPTAVGDIPPYLPPAEPYLGYTETEPYPGETTGEGIGRATGSVKDKASGLAAAAGEKVSGAASAVGDKISDAASSVGDKLSNVGSAARQYSARGSRTVSHQAGVLQDRFRESSDEYPLAVGGAFLAAGLLAGLLLPRTEKEDEWMGEASDELRDQTRDKAETLAQRGKDAALKTAGAAINEAEARGITPETLAAKASRVVSEAVKAGTETAREEGIAGSDIRKDAQAAGQVAAETAKSETQEAAQALE
ncbi:MAG: DUF3618 domain-containing protein [Chthoniobacterales bacterium]|nr:DUF3618 domain-containing protein [Chthoniobacterales bacterium]